MFLIRGYDFVALLPVEAVAQIVHPHGGVLGEGYLVGLRPEESGGRASGGQQRLVAGQRFSVRLKIGPVR